MSTTEGSTARWRPPDLRGKVALVTGASRGVGRGIALALGDCGATVVVTGRSTVPGSTTEGLPGDIHATATEVERRGGRGIAVACDHLSEERTRALFDRLAADHGRLDILVNNVWSGYERWGEQRFDAAFWQQPLWRYDLCHGSLRAHYLSSQLAAPLLFEADRALIVEIGYTDGQTYLGQVAYDIAKVACDRLAYAMAQDLSRTNVVALSLHPGFVRTERVAAAASAIGEGPAAVLHSCEYVGRAVAHIAADENAGRFRGAALAVGDLAVEYGFCDVDGRQPPAFRLEGRRSLANRMERLHRVALGQSASGPEGGR